MDRNEAETYISEYNLITWSQVTPRIFRQHANTNVLPHFGYSDRSILRITSYQWMYKLGFRPQKYHKSLYFDGHERPDVIIA